MKVYDLERFCIEQEDKINCFYRNDKEIFISQYKEHQLIYEKSLINDCKILNNVILNLDNSIAIIYINLNGDLILCKLIDDELQSPILLTKLVSKYKSIQIASLNNMLNIFYIKEVNNVNVLCFRRLNNKLLLSADISMDTLDVNPEIPYILNVKDNKLLVAYVKLGTPNYIGYRLFDEKKNNWSDFIVLDAYPKLIEDINFIKNNKHIAYTYTFRKSNNINLVFGVGENDIRKRIIDEMTENAKYTDISIIGDDRLNIITIDEKNAKIREVNSKGEAKLSLEVNLQNVDSIEKYYFETDRKILKNTIIIIKTIEGELYTDIDLIENNSEKIKVEKVIELPQEQSDSVESESIESDVIMTEEELKNEMKEKTIDKEYVDKLIDKITGYEEIINKFMSKFTQFDDDREELLNNIDDLNDQLEEKNIKISEFESLLIERQDMLYTYEDEIRELEREKEEVNIEIESKVNEIESLKQSISKYKHENEYCNNIIQTLENNKEIDKKIIEENLEKIKFLSASISKYENDQKYYNNRIQELESNKEIDKETIDINLEEIGKLNKAINKYENDIKDYNNKIEELNNILTENKEEINRVNEMNDQLKEKNSEEVSRLNKLLNKIKIENKEYVDEIDELKLQLSKLNDIIENAKEEKAIYVNEIKVLNNKVRELNRILRNGFM